MNLQFISDSTGKTTGVFIPIEEWNALKDKYTGIEEGEINIPSWQIQEVEKRLKDYENNPEEGLNFDKILDDIEKELNV